MEQEDPVLRCTKYRCL